MPGTPKALWTLAALAALVPTTAPGARLVGAPFRITHFLKSAASYDKTCDRCELGYTTKGEAIDAGEVIGVLN